MQKWRLGKHRGKHCAVRGDSSSRRRRALYGPTGEPCKNLEEAATALKKLNLATERELLPRTLSMDEIYGLYEKDREAEGVVNLTRIKEVARTLKPIWGSLTAEEITKEEVKRFTKIRRQQGCSDGTIRNDLAYITAALGFAQRNGFIGRAPAIAKPPVPRPRERWLTREELKRLISGAGSEHVRLFIILAICTAGRPKHILDLQWGRVDLERRTINLDDPEQGRTRKGRARVPINETALEALKRARLVAQTDYVIEHNGKPLKSIKRGVLAAANRANLKGVSQYVLRRTAGVMMAQAGVPIAEISEYLGHSNITTTMRVYAKFHPDHLRQASKSLEI